MKLEIVIDNAADQDELFFALANMALNITTGEYLDGYWSNIIGSNGEFMPNSDGYPIGRFRLTTGKEKG